MKHQRTTRQETMLAVIQMRKGIEKRIDTHTWADNTELGGGTPWVSLSSGTRVTLPNGVHHSPDSGLGEEVSFLQSRLPSSMLAGLSLMPAGTANLFPHGKLSLMPDTFLPSNRASDLHWTFQTCLSTGAITCPFSPFFQRAFFPGQGIPDEPPNVLPVVWIPDQERRLLETMQLAIQEFITDSSQGLLPSPTVWGWKGPEPQFSQVFIGYNY